MDRRTNKQGIEVRGSLFHSVNKMSHIDFLFQDSVCYVTPQGGVRAKEAREMSAAAEGLSSAHELFGLASVHLISPKQVCSTANTYKYISRLELNTNLIDIGRG